MDATLPQLHHGVHQVGQVGVAGALGQEAEVLLQDAPVKADTFYFMFNFQTKLFFPQICDSNHRNIT